MRILIDTNVLLRAAEPRTPQFLAASHAVDTLAKQGHTMCLVPQIIYEYWAVSTRPTTQNGRGKTPDEVLSELGFFETHFTMLPDTSAVFDEWKQLMSIYKVVGKPSHDARLVAALIAHRLTHLLTFNAADFQRYSGVVALDPVGIATIVPPP